MSEPLKQDQRVIADRSYPSGHTWVHAMPNDFWAYPLDDAVVEELAKAAHDSYFAEEWETTTGFDRELWRQVIEAVFAKLMGGDV